MSINPTIISDKLDLYQLLEINDDSNETSIRRAYRKIALKYHPDKNPSEEAKITFHNLNLALETLISNELRKSYDQLRRGWIEKELRKKELDVNRRKLQKELEENERDAIESIKSSLDGKRRLEMLKMEGLKRRKLHEEKMEKRVRGISTIPSASISTSTPESDINDDISENSRTVKLRIRQGSKLKNEEEITKLFAKFGSIDHVVVIPDLKGKKFFTVLIIFEGIDGAQLCVSKNYEGNEEYKGVKSARILEGGGGEVLENDSNNDGDKNNNISIDRNSSNYEEQTMKRLEMLAKRN